MKTVSKTLGIIALFFGFALSAQAQFGVEGIQVRTYVDGVENGKLTPLQPVNLEFLFWNKKTNVPFRDFERIMTKHMHLVIMSEDLSEFTHIHPFIEPGSGMFQIPLHLRSSHGDNKGVLRAIPKAGKYFVYSEVKMKTLGVKTFASEVEAKGEPNPVPLQVDQMLPSGSIVKYFTKEGTLGRRGDYYRVEFSREMNLSEDLNRAIIQLKFEIRELDRRGAYVAVTQLEPWMRMGGHAIMVSAAGDRAQDKKLFHVHGEINPGNPEVIFRDNVDRDLLPVGVYKIWAQFKIKGHIHTFPYVFDHKQFQ